MKAVIIIALLAFSNFTYQWLFETIPDYSIALERTYFQAVAILIAHFLFY